MDESGLKRVLEGLNCTTFKRTGNNLITNCPFAQWTHSGGTDKNPSFSISVNGAGTSPWKCWSCGEAAKRTISLIYRYKDHSGTWLGRVADEINEAEGGAPSNRLRKLKSWDQQARSYSGPKSATDWYVVDYEGKFNIEDFSETLAFLPQYALDRGITVDLAQRWKIGFDQRLGRLFFSILDENNQMVGWSGRAIYPGQEPKYMHAEYFKRDRYLYGEWLRDKDSQTGFIMESFMDVLNLSSLGLKNCHATMGVSPSAHQVEKLSRWYKRVIIFPHDDKPNEKGIRVGLKMADDYAEALRHCGVQAIVGPIVPHERWITVNGHPIYRNPQDPGEWSRQDLDWALIMIRRQLDANRTAASEETRREESQKEPEKNSVNEECQQRSV